MTRPRVSLKTKQQLAALRNLAALHSLDVQFSRCSHYATLKVRMEPNKVYHHYISAEVDLNSPVELWLMAVEKLTSQQ